MSLPKNDGLTVGFKSNKQARWYLKLAFAILLLPLVVMAFCHLFFPVKFHLYAFANEVNVPMLYAINGLSAVLGLLILKEKVWAAALVLFLIGAKAIAFYALEGQTTSGLAIAQFLLLINAFRATSFLQTNPEAEVSRAI
ncbi:hypothetical protein TW84_17030 [Vibrio neptunius]|uniref:hypothetical protein n=1 Tax=Vibrio neptunius TaxID=170651 RepID=UPI0005F9DE09|nr:hypothetical protein [Vibrio neptunius]KJY87577.1 hypothetical protein TW84_17030 [Vibrio neptunius]